MEGFAEVAWEGRPCYITPRDEMRHLPAACPLPWGLLKVTVPRERAGAADATVSCPRALLLLLTTVPFCITGGCPGSGKSCLSLMPNGDLRTLLVLSSGDSNFQH